MDKTPTQQNISYAWEQFSEQTKITLDAAAKGIALEARDHDVISDALVSIDLDEDKSMCLAHTCALPEDLATLYRCRWEVETLFRELKTQYELDEFDTRNPAIVKILLYAALLSLLVSRDLLDLVTEQADDEIVFPPERWAAIFRSHAQLILHELGEYLGYSPPPLLERLIEDAQKIHQQRPILQETLATATQPRCES